MPVPAQFGRQQGFILDEDGSADLRYVLEVARTFGRHISRYTLLVTKSTVPVGTAAAIKASLLVTIGRWLRAQCVLIVITFFQLLVGLLLIRQPYALLLAVVIAFIDALPVFGTGTVLLPWAVLCCLEGNFPKGIALTALYLVIWLVRSIMEPKLMAKSAGLPPLPALMAMYVGFCAMGVAGMILGPILLLLVKQLHDGGYLHLWK